MNNTEGTMLMITGELPASTGTYYPTFKMIPTAQECPFNEVIYDGELEVLFVIGKEKKKFLHKVAKITDMVTEKFYEYHIKEKAEIVNFINLFATNSHDFDYTKFLN